MTVQLTRAEFLLDDQKPEQARPLLESLHTSHPRHPGVLHWLAKTYRQMAAWEPLEQLLAELKKQNVLSNQTFVELQQQTYHGLLESAAAGNSLERLRALWKRAPAALREEDAVSYTHLDVYKRQSTCGRGRWNPRCPAGTFGGRTRPRR